jgi:hypothetical protein
VGSHVSVAHPQVDGFELHPSGSAHPHVDDQHRGSSWTRPAVPIATISPTNPISPRPGQFLLFLLFATTLVGGCARPPFARGEVFRLGHSVGVCKRALGSCCPGVFGTSSGAWGACAVHSWSGGAAFI